MGVKGNERWLNLSATADNFMGGMLGKKHSQETIQKMREKAKLRKHSEETLSKLRRPKPPEQIAKMAASMKGKRHTQETREKMSRSHKLRFLNEA